MNKLDQTIAGLVVFGLCVATFAIGRRDGKREGLREGKAAAIVNTGLDGNAVGFVHGGLTAEQSSNFWWAYQQIKDDRLETSAIADAVIFNSQKTRELLALHLLIQHEMTNAAIMRMLTNNQAK